MRVELFTHPSDPIHEAVPLLREGGIQVQVLNGGPAPPHGIALFTLGKGASPSGRHVRMGPRRLGVLPEWAKPMVFHVGVRKDSLRKVVKEGARNRGTLFEALWGVQSTFRDWKPGPTPTLPWVTCGLANLDPSNRAEMEAWYARVLEIADVDTVQEVPKASRRVQHGASVLDHGVSIQSELPTIRLNGFLEGFGGALGALTTFLRSDELRQHPRWGRLLPFDVVAYGTNPSLGHCVRPDIVLTKDGPRICELDFVCSGRGWTLANLTDQDQQAAYLDAYATWYRGMGVERVSYATASTTVCFEETVAFAEGMRSRTGIDVVANNVDHGIPGDIQLVDRLFYRSEMVDPTRADGLPIITAEPWLDSKMVFALVHDPLMTTVLEAAIGPQNLAILREVMIETRPHYANGHLLSGDLSNVLGYTGGGCDLQVPRRHGWVLKNADVESDACWGCRGVVMGRKYGEDPFERALREQVSPPHKDLGSRQVLQRFVPSLDFTPVWDAAVDGRITRADPGGMGKGQDARVLHPATREVYGRVGVYFLIDNQSGSVTVPPAGILTMRQDALAHGAQDAMITAFHLA